LKSTETSDDQLRAHYTTRFQQFRLVEEH